MFQSPVWSPFWQLHVPGCPQNSLVVAMKDETFFTSTETEMTLIGAKYVRQKHTHMYFGHGEMQDTVIMKLYKHTVNRLKTKTDYNLKEELQFML